MKSAGIIRKIDDLGRVVLPIGMRQILDINEKDALELYLEDNAIVIKKHHPACVFCNATADTIPFGDKLICKTCLASLKNEN